LGIHGVYKDLKNENSFGGDLKNFVHDRYKTII